jgi:Protein of unknown function (DUF3551)
MRLLTGLALFTALALVATSAGAEEWCGFHDKAGSHVRCGFSSLTDCKQAIGGKNAVCIPSPSFAKRDRRGTAGRPG